MYSLAGEAQGTGCSLEPYPGRPSGGGDEDDCSYMDVTVQSNAGGSKAGSRSGSVGAASPSTIDQFAQGTTPFISPAGVILTPIVAKNHPLALNPTTDDGATAYYSAAWWCL